MVAFTRARVPVVDVAAGRIVVATDPFAEAPESASSGGT
jgi:hypothetical protein